MVKRMLRAGRQRFPVINLRRHEPLKSKHEARAPAAEAALFDGYRLGKVARLVDVSTLEHGHMISQ